MVRSDGQWPTDPDNMMTTTATTVTLRQVKSAINLMEMA